MEQQYSRSQRVLSRVFRNVRQGLRLAWEASPAGLVGVAAFAAVSAAVPTVEVWLSKRFVDGVIAAQRAGGPGAGLWLTVVALGLAAALQRALGVLRGNRQQLFSQRVQNAADVRLVAKAADVDLGHFDSPDWHDRMARAVREVSWRSSELAYSGVGLLASLLTLGGLLGLLLTLSPLLVLLAVVSVLPVFLIDSRTTRRLLAFWFVATPADRERRYLRDLLTDARWAKEVRSFGLEAYLLARFRSLTDGLARRLAAVYAAAARAALVSALIGGVALAGAYYVLASRGAAGHFTAGDLAASIAAMAAIASELGLVASTLVFLDQHAAFLDDYFAFLSIPKLVPAPAAARPVPDLRPPGVELRGVTFRYPGAVESALAGFDLAIRPGELVALVGDNGAGKTSVVKLLLRLYDPQEGSVRFGGVDVRELDPAALRSRVGVLFQDYATYELTARENVTLGRPGREPHDGPVLAALAAARATGVVGRLPKGLDSSVGRLFEGGHDLSTGEWQRLALARLLYREADVWILDEPTAALDAESESAVFAELRQNLRGRTGIVISHRFSTVRVADRIAVLAGGRVGELGTHDQLMAAGGRYAHLFELQAAGYR
ncbi:MAG TPA: ABC transporter ATP-binding protein [Candidatus Dormibacteraeota bacterium]|nr:ABC transporter ATP-binding protein [Candidatus Dormibacteraeota bacterium]